MKSSDEIKKGLECCAASYADCHKECPYKPDCDGSQILKDALALIQQLQAEKAEQTERIKQLEKRVIHLEALNQSDLTTITMQERTRARFQERISQLEAERDAAVESMRNDPHCCYHCANMTKRGICQSEPRADGHCFEWRGVQKEE